ncbi:MAG: class I SAM-dependent methyltransferase [Pirellulales bacterium]|nr:class I SAM-dependent methyltransferase [Pirellulales bacterium]
MPIADTLRLLYLSHLSNPPTDRIVYRTICRNKVRRILECGIGEGRRAVRMIDAARRAGAGADVHFVGIDPFEARSACDGPGVTLKLAHRVLASTGAHVRLLPGDPFTALARGANALGPVDLVVISARQNADALAQAWFYFPRMLHAGSTVLMERVLPGGQVQIGVIATADVARLAAVARRRAA